MRISDFQSSIPNPQFEMFLLGLVTRDLMLGLSTLYRAHRRDGTFFICGNGCDVLLLNFR